MFRRFRRQKDKNPGNANHAQRQPMLPPPPDTEDDEGTSTLPLRAMHPAGPDDWLLSEDAPTARVQAAQRPPSQPLREQGPRSQPFVARSQAPVMTIDPDQVAQALEEYLNAPDWQTSRQVVETHPELLSNTALMLLRSNMVRVAEQVGPAAAQIMSRYLQTLEAAQREGVAFAFDRMESPYDQPFAPDLDALLTRLESPEMAQNLLARVMLCEEALPLAARDQNDELWAALQRELGLIMPRMTYGDHTQNVERALDALSAALQIFTKLEYPIDWAMTQHYLGLAYLARVAGNRAHNVDQAIDALEAALEVRTRDTLPAEWAATQEALGSAYYHCVSSDRSDNIDRSIAAYEAALQVRTREKAPLEWATDQLSLGNAYGQRLTGTRMTNIEQAITGFEAALTYFTRDNAPEQWALIHHNLGVAYMDRLFGDRADNVDRAIGHYEQAMLVQTRDRAPLEWADTLNNLGNALRERINGVRSENVDRAIACYKDALRVRTRTAFLAEHRRTARNLGTLLFELERWSAAHEMLSSALAASKILYALELGNGMPSQRLRDHSELVALDAVCLVRLKRFHDAVQQMESGRARALDEMAERDRMALIAAPAADRLTFEHAQARLLAATQAQQRVIIAGGVPSPENLHLGSEDRPSGPRRDSDAVAFERREAQAAFDAAIAVIHKTRPDFLHPLLAFKKIAGAVNKGQALVYLATTSQGTLALLIPGGTSTLTDDHVLWAPELTTARIDELAPRVIDDETVIKTHLGHLPRPKVLDRLLDAIGKELMAPLAARLHQFDVGSVILVPSGRLATIPLHAAPIGMVAPTRDDEGAEEEPRAVALFIDAFETASTPSAHRLMLSRAGGMITLKSGVAAVGNPQPASVQLEWSEHEAEAVAQVTNRAGQSCTLLIRRQATAEGVAKAIKDRAYIHLACASGFHPERPLESYLELSEGDRLRLVEVLDGTIPLRGVRLLVLSAGQSAVTTVNAPDESIGMAATMLAGGAAAVAGSLWPASDLATLLLMRRFAQNYLDDNQRPAQALRNAQRWLRALTLEQMTRDFSSDLARDPDLNLADFTLPNECPFAHPFFWAGFVLYGA
jgi:CHAT domain-containing protein/tetratricopeptide (TPR) repeat protein